MTINRPYDLTGLDPFQLEDLLHKRPDLRKEIFEEANHRLAETENTALINTTLQNETN
jgi:hypothetical protein